MEFRQSPMPPDADRNDDAGKLLGNIQATINQLELLISEKTDIIDLLSHDLRSPVNRIMSLSNLIKIDGEANKDLYADYITNECKGLLRMLENMLLMLKENNQHFRLNNVNLKQLILEITNFFDFALADKKIRLVIDITDQIVIQVQEELFTQAIRNLIGNAIKFSADNQSIYITAKELEGQVSLSITDEGLGFVQDDIQKIFDRFTKAGKKGTHGEASVGLGLYLSKKIIEKHGGTLTANSDGPGKGATFTVNVYHLVTKKKQEKHFRKPGPNGLAH